MPDWLGQAKIAATGIATVIMQQNNPAMVWQIEQVSVSVGTVSTQGNVAIFKNDNMVAPTSALVPQTNQYGQVTIGQTAAGLPYIYLNASDKLQVVVNSATSGDTMTVRAQYVEMDSSDNKYRGR
jgi:VCBS repeat-containing protein